VPHHLPHAQTASILRTTLHGALVRILMKDDVM
jgi:hypothetical protein